MIINIAKTIFMWTSVISLILSVLNGLTTKHKEISMYEDAEKKKTPLEVCILAIVVIATLSIIILTLKIIESSKRRYGLLYIITLIFIPILIGIDVSLIVLRVLYSFLLEAIGYVFLFLKVIKKAVGKTVIWINNLSDRRLVATSFRVALIMTLALTVSINRYTPLLRAYDASTGVLEFVAGTILIPVIFEWIASNKTKQNKCKNEN